MRTTALLTAATVALAASAPARAEVTATSEQGFVTATTVMVEGKTPAEIWPVLLRPAKWWNPIHSWSGDAENLYLDAQAGSGSSSQKQPPAGSPEGTRRGSVEHARVLAAMPPRLLRLNGALGPLQGEALAGALTIVLKPKAGGTELSFSYVIGGFMRMKVGDIAPIVDKVLAEQASRLAGLAQAPAAPEEPSDPRRRR